jgi:hypothetical protein
MLFERQGGGNLVFNISRTSSTDTFLVNVTRMEFRDTSIQITLTRNSGTTGLLDTLVESLNGHFQLDGSFTQSTLPTGTWAYVYLVNDKSKKEITNLDLRTTLLKLEPLVLLKCSIRVSPNNNPTWVNELIEKYENEPVGNPPQSIWQYEYKNQIVYYSPPQCCDQYSIRYDSSGTVLCAPDGGFTGGGDGKCPDFFQERKNGRLIWCDTRTR